MHSFQRSMSLGLRPAASSDSDGWVTLAILMPEQDWRLNVHGLTRFAVCFQAAPIAHLPSSSSRQTAPSRATRSSSAPGRGLSPAQKASASKSSGCAARLTGSATKQRAVQEQHSTSSISSRAPFMCRWCLDLQIACKRCVAAECVVHNVREPWPVRILRPMS